jgi:hypothetical protein
MAKKNAPQQFFYINAKKLKWVILLLVWFNSRIKDDAPRKP